MRRRPALLLAIPFSGGVFLGGSIDPGPAWLGLATSLALLAVPALAFLAARRGAALLLSLILGIVRGHDAAPRPIESAAAWDAVVEWVGRVEATRPGGFRLDSVRGRAPGDVRPVALRGRVDVLDDGAAIEKGAWVAVSGPLEVIDARRNPGLPDARLLARRDRVVARLRATGATREIAPPDSRGRLATRLDAWRARFAEREDALYPRDVAAYLRALFLGDRALLDPALRWDFRDTGTAHLLALSGQHVVLIALIVERAVAFLGVPYTLRVPADLVALGAYLALVGAPASVARAGLVLALFLLARPLRRRFDAGNALGAALLVLLALSPEDLWDPGLTLSFGATAGLVFLLPILRERLASGRGRLARLLLEPLCVTLAASWPLVPLEGLLFGAVPIAGLAANLLLVPATGLLLGFHVGVLACAAVPWAALHLPSPVADVAAATSLLARATLAAVAAAARALPPPLVLPAAWAPFALLYAALTLLALRPPRALRGSAMLLAPVLALVAAGIPVRPPLRVTVYDVGQGDAILIESREARVLVDAGPRWAMRDAGERVVAPALRAAGIRRLDALLLSHGDADHCGGAEAVLGAIAARRLIEPDPRDAPRSRTHAGARAAAARRGAASIALAEGDTLRLPGVRARVLHPPRAPRPPALGANGNARSIVLDVSCGSVHVLLTGDLPSEEEERLVARGSLPRGALLKVAHHGSRGSTGGMFLDAVRPPAALLSVGARNRYGHPHPMLLARLDAAGARVLRTDQDGALVVEADGSRVLARGTLPGEAPIRLVYLAPDDPHPAGPLPRAPVAAVPVACD